MVMSYTVKKIRKNTGVILDSNLSFEKHISNVTKTAFFHLRNIAKLRNMLSVSDAEKLVHAFMTSRLDYCNALLGGCPASSINKLQVVQNAATRVLTRSIKYDNFTTILQSLYWLPIKFRISYKIVLLAYKALNGLAPAYLTSLIYRYNPSRSLRSQNVSGYCRNLGSLRAGTRHHGEFLRYGNSFPSTFPEVLLAHASQ